MVKLTSPLAGGASFTTVCTPGICCNPFQRRALRLQIKACRCWALPSCSSRSKELRRPAPSGMQLVATSKRRPSWCHWLPLLFSLRRLRRSLDLLEQLGNAQQRQALICERSARLWNGLQQIPAAQTVVQEAPPTSGLVSFTIAHAKAQEAVSSLADQHFQLRSLEDPLCLRACTHVFSTEAEIDQLLEAISQL